LRPKKKSIEIFTINLLMPRIPMPGLHLINMNSSRDSRGKFHKTYASSVFNHYIQDFSIKEQFVTTSAVGVIRGMHFQLPPYDHVKIVTCLSGAILDVVLDLRMGSLTYGHYDYFHLSPSNSCSVLIPAGVAHGFASLKSDSVVLYNVSSEYSQAHDCGIHYDSFGMIWPFPSPILSDRDQRLQNFNEFNSPFIFRCDVND